MRATLLVVLLGALLGALFALLLVPEEPAEEEFVLEEPLGVD